MRRKIRGCVPLLLAAVLFFCGCGGRQEQESVSERIPTPTETAAAPTEAEAEPETEEAQSTGSPSEIFKEQAESLPTPAAEPEQPQAEETAPESRGKMVAVDAGHQGEGNSEQEPIGPGASETKAKVSSGTYGSASGLNEYELNLQVSLQLRDELSARGYEVFMIRETNDVNISNRERAETAALAGADILVRIHANGSEDPSVSGALTMAPSEANPYVGSMAGECQRLSRDILDAYCAATGAASQGVYLTDDMSGINWSTIPVTIVEMGYMTNPEEDLKLASPGYQQQIVQGIANGIDLYFAGQEER